MSKNTRAEKEYTREQKLVNENKQLKRELAKLRKMLARIDLDRYSTIKDMLQEHEMKDKLDKTEPLLSSLKEEWKCHDCLEGYLEIVIFSKVGDLWYFRACNSCQKRTKSQKYTPEVRGLIKKS